MKWNLSTVRAIGGHDRNPRFSCYFSPHTLRLSRSQFSHAHANTAAPVADLMEEPDSPVVASSSAQSHPTVPRDALRSSLRPFTDPFEDHHPRGAACCRASHSAIDVLKQFLSSENISSDRPLIYSPTTLRSLYYRAESRDQLAMLDSKMLTLLMGLFGSLSIDPCIPIGYRVPLASRLFGVSTRRTHWAFVLKVGRYKLERRMHMQDSDRFWMMRAELGIVQAKAPLERDDYNAILRARTHYHIIRRHSHCPETHACYLETLLVIQDPRLLNFAACDLSFLLRTHRVCHPRLHRLLYRLVIQHGESLSTQSKEAILAALWSRSCQGTNGTSDLVPENILSGVALDDHILDATTTARTLSTTLLGFAGHLHSDESATSFGHLFSVFSPTYTLSLRWGSLILFSIFNSSKTLRFSGTHWTCDPAMPQVTSCWQVIFGLATVERIIQDPCLTLALQPTSTEGVSETIRTLYQLWLPIIKSCPVSRDLACAIATSFFKIANVLADASLFYDCRELYQVENDSEGPRTSVPKHLAAQYIAVAVRIQGFLPDVVLGALKALAVDWKQQQQILASAVEALAPIDPTLAYKLYIFAHGQGLGPDSGVTHMLAMSFAQRGALREAILLLNDGQFSREKRGILISAIARSLRENPRTRHPPSVLVAVVDELATFYHSYLPPEHFRGHLEELLVFLAQHGRGSQLFPVVLSISRMSSSFFQPRFFVRYCRVLIRHRQFAAASELLDAIATVHPKVARSLCVVTTRVTLQTRPFLFKGRTSLRRATSLRLSSRLRRSPYAELPLEWSLQGLVKSRRLLAAKHLFASAAATIPSRRRTALGNILLHGASHQPSSRNGRRVRKVLALLENLVKKHGFQPDRVTANILIKAMIGWRSAFDSPRLRELFDQLVRGGHPAADYSPLNPPFGTRQTQFSGSSGFSKPSSYVSFEKHSRPLFKMFIKAFYLCNDVEAARKVVGILKVEEYRNAAAKEARRRARTRGRMRAAQRNVIPDDTVPRID